MISGKTALRIISRTNALEVAINFLAYCSFPPGWTPRVRDMDLKERASRAIDTINNYVEARGIT